MKLNRSKYLVYASFLPSAIWGAISNNTTVINFDDIPTVSGLANVPNLYHHFSFSSYNILKPRDPALKGRISKNDLNCAVSSPNALIGSRYSGSLAGSPKGAYFEISNASAMKKDRLYPHFTLLTFNIKPMDAPLPGTSITVIGYSHFHDDPYVWQVDFPAGFHLPFLVKMQEYSGEDWDQIYGIEILADFGEDSLDWEFCIDDLEVQFFKLPDEVPGRLQLNQAVLKT